MAYRLSALDKDKNRNYIYYGKHVARPQTTASYSTEDSTFTINSRLYNVSLISLRRSQPNTHVIFSYQY